MKRGVLKFVASPMNGGKTTNMLLRAKRASILGWKVLLAKPQVDTRHKSTVIRSRCGAEMECNLCVDSQFNFAKDISYKDVDILFVDEAQFLSARQIEELREVVDVHGISVWCYGLLTDFKKNLFAGSKRLVELCDKMYELDVLCCFCSESGRFHLKYADGKADVSGPSIDVSTPGNDKFVSVCHKCWMEKMSASEEKECARLFCNEGVSVDKAVEING
ncbi:thymidine kinase [Encephalitozoon hellem ATCC 50504]|uniref:Thymidine kinase n=1 Tax=Encephalitozoon hellem TaxID=27973 RepID=A0A9Q9C1J4_ENCHE|nr:thymidine kinase [Encephalitozoon hellem ATCC 50504]AFM97685.1 thymidine kinase [Encephalitozoon hellem ATCC 50504]UTX42376.1 thymidine kinase [Encephalitozoon hellem]WEL37818.1 thymidine kinase [Encephalitozoon hellem]|eukprot:XP_003886666.1 thymidine kinase [Encephalitozoon hellem ATCC 50504]